MTYRGKVQNGVVILQDSASLPEGTEVRVEPVPPARAPSQEGSRSSLFRIGERAKPTGIPDLAINHDHYLYGHPKVDNG
jgi:hypothetical protein